MINFFILLYWSLISGIFYWLGGQGGAWYKDSWIRDYVCPLIVIAYLPYHWSLWLCYPLMVGALSTYWKKKGTNATWRNWFLHGFGIGLALLPYVVFTHSLQPILVRVVLLGISMAIWSHFNHIDKWDEGGRGALIILTLFFIKEAHMIIQWSAIFTAIVAIALKIKTIIGWCGTKWTTLKPILTPVILKAEELAQDGVIDKADRKQLVNLTLDTLQKQNVVKLNFIEKWIIGMVIDYMARRLPDFKVSAQVEEVMAGVTKDLQKGA